MKRIRIYFSLLILLILLASVGAGFMTAASFRYDVSFGNYLDRKDLNLNLDENEDFISIYFDNEVRSLEDLMKKSDYIVKVKPSNERINYFQAVRSAVQVIDVYKGKNSDVKKGSLIHIYEPSHFYNSVYSSFGGYQIMSTDSEYLMFIKHLPTPEGYKYKGDEALSFVPVSTYYGKYPISDKILAEKLRVLTQKEIEDGLPYVRVKDWEVITTKPEVLQTYRSIKKSVLSKFK